eukprot:TRINITY_DN4626_c0_g1_i2.p1 TRINITY_DN4626_c0_g1~~TRINITY_DN4626_c0_g1_i2.p1  ORF type:complete len:286 (-),score=77.09 TRINITY_DN4626_c0_g1_i2:825-1595(-)
METKALLTAEPVGPSPMVMVAQPDMSYVAAPQGSDFMSVLNNFSTLLVKQRPKGWCIELCLGCEIENEYRIYDPTSSNPQNQILVAAEESSCVCRQCCQNNREFTMKIKTLANQEICQFERPFRWGFPCCKGCRQAVICYSPNHQYLGTVEQIFSCCLPVFSVLDASDNEIFRIVGNCCICCNYTLHIYRSNHGLVNEDMSIGTILKKWSGMGQELFTDADNFVIQFPAGATAAERVLLLGALFLVDFMFFERRKK